MKVVRGCVDLRAGQEEQATYTGGGWASGKLGGNWCQMGKEVHGGVLLL